ncbi:MAG: hypothetical protein ACYS76_16220 [Planctomycetota bacterium]|jgi:hypothetical protein
MVLAKPTGGTDYNYAGVSPSKTLAQFNVLFGDANPVQPIHWANASYGYKTTPQVHIGGGSAGAERVVWNAFPNRQIGLDIALGATNDWYDFADSTGNNIGFGVEGEYSDPPTPPYNFNLFQTITGAPYNVNAIYTEDDNNLAYDAPPPESDLDYELTSRANWTAYAPNKPASARLAKNFLCGNTNKISFASKQAISTAFNDATVKS